MSRVIRSSRSLLRRATRPVVVEPLEDRLLFAFGLTTTPTSYVVDTGADVKFTILRAGSTTSTIHLGDVTSVTYKGSEMLAPYSATDRYSHYEQGLSSVTAVSATVDPAGNWIKITCDDSNTAAGGIGIVHYYLAKKGDNNIYMASLPLDVNAAPGEGRFIAYLSKNLFTNLGLEKPSDISANNGAVEGSDVFHDSSGLTRSKFYNTRRMIENAYHGVTGTAVGAWMFMGNREHSAGGPFFKDIDFQTTSNATEIYNCLFTGHTQTEPFRQGLQGPYALQFTDGALPTAPDYAWMENTGLQGWVPAAQRGALTGTATGVPAGHESTVALSNTTAQYWAAPNPTTGTYTIAAIQPGTYTETLYDNELAVGTRTVTITAAQTTRADITNTSYTPSALFRIGTWDGTPKEFLNADRINTMHPSDPRMSDWTLPTFTVGATPDTAWPLAQFKDINNARRIVFNLTAAQVQALTLRVGLTLAFASGRPNITVNAGQTYAWTSAFQSPSSQPDSRGITRGTWRGNNVIHSFDIPASKLRAGVNTIDISVISGETSTGFLSPSVTYDAIDLVPTATLTSAPHVNSIAITPANSSVGPAGLKTFAATAYDQFNKPIPANIDWSATRSLIDDTGLYTAPATTGPDTITATVGAVTASTTASVLAATPILVNPAAAAANVVYNNTTTLSVLATGDAGESNLTYTWSVSPPTPAAIVTFSANRTNAARNTTATFTKPGDYTLLVTISDGTSTATSTVKVSVRDAVARYKADTTTGALLADSSGANNTARLFGIDGSYTLTQGAVGNALQLTGGNSGGYASLPTGIVSNLNDFTISAWVKPDAANNWSRIFDFGAGPKVYMFLTARAGVAGNPLRFAITTNGGAGEQIVNGPLLAIGAWTHVAVTLAGNTATLYVNGRPYVSNTGVTLRPSSLGVTTNNFIGKSQYPDPAFQGGIDDFCIYGRALSAAEILAAADVTPPQVVNATFAYAIPPSITLTFSDDVLATLDATDLSILNTTTGLTIPASEFTFTRQGATGAPTTATWTHTGPLPDGNYVATLPAASVADPSGNSLAADYSFPFFVLAGDANRDRAVDFNDMVPLAQNYNTTGKTYAQGDFTGDGAVDFNDLVLLAQHYNTTLPAPAIIATAAPTPALALASTTTLVTDTPPARPLFSTTRVTKHTPTKPKRR